MVRKNGKTSWLRVLVVGAVALSIGSCAGQDAQVKATAYPLNFEYVGDTKVRSAMWRIAERTVLLDQLFRRSQPLTADDRTHVIKLLNEMLSAAMELGDGQRLTNHPQIDRNLDAFMRDIRRARDAAQLEPPNYFQAGIIHGSCQLCHFPRN